MSKQQRQMGAWVLSAALCLSAALAVAQQAAPQAPPSTKITAAQAKQLFSLVDELILYVAPVLLGADAAPLAALGGLDTANPLMRFDFREQRLIQNDLRLVLTPKRN